MEKRHYQQPLCKYIQGKEKERQCDSATTTNLWLFAILQYYTYDLYANKSQKWLKDELCFIFVILILLSERPNKMTISLLITFLTIIYYLSTS